MGQCCTPTTPIIVDSSFFCLMLFAIFSLAFFMKGERRGLPYTCASANLVWFKVLLAAEAAGRGIHGRRDATGTAMGTHHTGCRQRQTWAGEGWGMACEERVITVVVVHYITEQAKSLS